MHYYVIDSLYAHNPSLKKPYTNKILAKQIKKSSNHIGVKPIPVVVSLKPKK